MNLPPKDIIKSEDFSYWPEVINAHKVIVIALIMDLPFRPNNCVFPVSLRTKAVRHHCKCSFGKSKTVSSIFDHERNSCSSSCDIIFQATYGK